MKTNHSFWEKCVERRIERGMERGTHRFIHFVAHFIFGAAFVAAFGFVIMWLWNWLVPEIIGWQAVNYWQALGLFILCKLLFGGFWAGKRCFGRKHGHHHFHDNPMREKWLAMTPDERKEFIKKMSSHRGFGRGGWCCNETKQNEESASE